MDAAEDRRLVQGGAALGDMVGRVTDAACAGGVDPCDVLEAHVTATFGGAKARLRRWKGAPLLHGAGPVRSGGNLLVPVPGLREGRWVLELEGVGEVSDDESALAGHAAQLAGLLLHLGGRRTARRPNGTDGAAPLIGSTPAMAKLRRRLERVAATDFTVLVEGESGTGKELVARQIHEISRRRAGPFVAVNCAALVETLLEAELFGIEERTATGVRGRAGKFEHAHGGTLFLDEIADLSLSAQAKLLRAIQDLAVERVGGHGAKRVDVRIVAATNQALADAAARGIFRTDLFYRLSGVEIAVPPLRARRDDIRELVHYFLSRHAETRTVTFSPVALDALQVYEWPGNVRELERLVESTIAMVEGPRIELDDLPAKVRGESVRVLGASLERQDTLREWGSRYARLVYERCGRNKRRTCRWLNISYHTLVAYLEFGKRVPSLGQGQMPAWARDGWEASPQEEPGEAARLDR